MSAPSQRKEQKTITAKLTELLRDDIVSGRLPSGSRVTVADVAARYGVGQMPVREALQRLQGERIIVLLPNKGARVLSLDEQFVNNIYDLRGAIESLLMRLAVPNLTNAIMARLAAICGEIDRAARTDDAKVVRALNGEFHRLVYRHAGNPVVRNTPGVTGFVGMGNTPTALRPEDVSQIVKRMEAEAPTVKVTYKVGERVRIVDGPFNDFRGMVSEIDMERSKVRVMVSFFGRETPVELDFLQVEKA
jgi:DNA-binding transcriptional regulator YhcF (GntR family)